MFNYLKFFKSVKIPTDNRELVQTFESLEEILQQEHGSDGKHPIATTGNAGFMSPQDKQKLDEIWKYVQQTKSKG